MKTDNDLQGTDTIQTGLVPPRIFDSSHGTIQMTPHEAMVAGSYVSIRFHYTVGEKGFNAGGNLRIGTPCTGWGEPLPRARVSGFLCNPQHFTNETQKRSFSPMAKAVFKLSVDNKMIRYTPPGGAWRWWISVQLEEEALLPGDVIEVIYGDKTWGAKGVQVQKFLEKEAYFEVLVDLEGDGRYVEIPASPFIFDVISPPQQKSA